MFLAQRVRVSPVVTSFEHHLNQWLLAVELDDKSRKHGVKEEIGFPAEMFLRKPRLPWLWSGVGGG